MDDQQRFMLLNLIPDIGSLRAKRLLEALGSIEAVFAAGEAQLRQVEDIGPILSRRVVEWCRRPERLEEELALARKAGCEVLTQADAGYPAPLREIHDPPLALYIKGSWSEPDRLAVAIVGSRHASLYGQQTAERLAYELASRGITIVSGLARGIDAAAHRGALKAKGRTLAVLGNGLSAVYPPEHASLAAEVAERGALVSEYAMSMEPLARNFPRRNRLISGLSLGVVVVEAAARSGALITADSALEQGREVFAVPGKVDSLTSQGTNALLKQGARLVTSVEDILEELHLELVREAGPVTCGTPPSVLVSGAAAGADTAARKLLAGGRGLPSGATRFSPDETLILASLGTEEPCELDLVVTKTGLAASTCASVLLGLELKRQVKQFPGKRFVASFGERGS